MATRTRSRVPIGDGIRHDDAPEPDEDDLAYLDQLEQEAELIPVPFFWECEPERVPVAEQLVLIRWSGSARALNSTEYDRDRKAFEKKYHIDMKAVAREHYGRYLKEKGTREK